ncbi:MAG: ribosome maturation factor RimM [Pseudomonadota bacterium]
MKNPVLLATIGAAHGLRGEVRVKPYTEDPFSIADYGPLRSKDGQRFKVKALRPQKAMLVVKFEGINDRTAAEALANIDLYVDRSALPDDTEDDEYYVTDLIGCTVLDRAGAQMGTVVTVPDFGAGALLEIAGAGPSWFLDFTSDTVPEVDLAARTITVIPPQEVSERDLDKA